MYEYDPEKANKIYAWLAHYDVERITFLTGKVRKFLKDIKNEFDDFYEEIMTEPSKVKLN